MKIVKTLSLLLLSTFSFSQNSINGTFPALSNQNVKLVGFQGFDIYTIDSVKANDNGYFELSFNETDYGMGYLAAEDNKAFIVILASNENLSLEGEVLASTQSVSIVSGKQNQLFGQYAREHPSRENALSAWEFLARIYHADSLFSIHQSTINFIESEIQRIKREDDAFLASLNPETYVSWFLPVRKLVSSVSTIAQYRTHEIPVAIAAFREMDYTDPRLYKSGLLREAIEAHFWLIENSGRPLDSVFIEMNVSIDYMVKNLLSDEKKFNEITDYLFKLLEKRSLFKSSEYLAIKVLNENSCTVNNHLAAQLESYRAMKIGNTSSDFTFSKEILAPGYQPDKLPQKLSDLKNKYTLIVFGASWCPACPNELKSIAKFYNNWTKHGVEVVFVSLDKDKQAFEEFAVDFPFISVCDYKGWESPSANLYHVFATPTMYLLDSNRKILLRPNSVNHMDSWVDWFLVQGHIK